MSKTLTKAALTYIGEAIRATMQSMGAFIGDDVGYQRFKQTAVQHLGTTARLPQNWGWRVSIPEDLNTPEVKDKHEMWVLVRITTDDGVVHPVRVHVAPRYGDVLGINPVIQVKYTPKE